MAAREGEEANGRYSWLGFGFEVGWSVKRKKVGEWRRGSDGSRLY
jgi:hypothetical protein